MQECEPGAKLEEVQPFPPAGHVPSEDLPLGPLPAAQKPIASASGPEGLGTCDTLTSYNTNGTVLSNL